MIENILISKYKFRAKITKPCCGGKTKTRYQKWVNDRLLRLRSDNYDEWGNIEVIWKTKKYSFESEAGFEEFIKSL